MEAAQQRAIAAAQQRAMEASHARVTSAPTSAPTGAPTSFPTFAPTPFPTSAPAPFPPFEAAPARLFQFDEAVLFLFTLTQLLSGLWWVVKQRRRGKALWVFQIGWIVLAGCLTGGSWSTLHTNSFEEGVMLLIAAVCFAAGLRWLYLCVGAWPALGFALVVCLTGGSWSVLHTRTFDEMMLLLVSVVTVLAAIFGTAQGLRDVYTGSTTGGAGCRSCVTELPRRVRDALVALLLACCCYARPYSFLAGVAKTWTLGGRRSSAEDAATVDLEQEVARLQLLLASERASSSAYKSHLEANMAQVRALLLRGPERAGCEKLHMASFDRSPLSRAGAQPTTTLVATRPAL